MPKNNELVPLRAEIVPALPDGDSSAEAAELEPFFRPRDLSQAIRARQTVAENHKWSWYFSDHGCLICQRTDTSHHALGMCQACFGRTNLRLKASMRRRATESNEIPTFRDTARLAREALLPSIENLANQGEQEMSAEKTAFSGKRTARIVLKIDPELHQTIKQLAKENCRTLQLQVIYFVNLGLDSFQLKRREHGTGA